MKVTLDFPRILHLLILVVLTYAGAIYLKDQWELSGLAAFGLSCFTVCQISNVFLKLASSPEVEKTSPETLKRSNSGTRRKKNRKEN